MKPQKYTLDAAGQSLGRLASKIAVMLRSEIDAPPKKLGSFHIVVSNINQLGNLAKLQKTKTYFSHSGYPKGTKITKFSEVFAKDPKKVVLRAVAGMLPKNRQRSQLIKLIEFKNSS